MAKQSSLSWFDLTRWILAAPLGWLLGATFFLNVWQRLAFSVMDNLVVTAAGFFLFGAIIGATQWLALNRVLPRLASWSAVTGFGFLVSVFLMLAVPTSAHENVLLNSIILGLVFGLPIGLVQAVLWYKQKARVRWWATANVLGCIGGFVLVALPSNWSWSMPALARIDVPSTTMPPAAAALATGLALKIVRRAQTPAAKALQDSAS